MAAEVGGRRGVDENKRTSRNTDDNNPTRSGIQYPSPRYRTVMPAPEPVACQGTPVAARVPRGPADELGADQGDEAAPKSKTHAPRSAARFGRPEASVELKRVAGRGATRALQELERAAEAFNAGHERDAMRIIRPLREAYPDVAAIRELLGLCHYRLGAVPGRGARSSGTSPISPARSISIRC